MGSEHTLNPTGGVLSRRGAEEPASSHQLLEHILSPENIGEAWERVRANKGAPGIDGVTVDAFPDAFRKRWAEICSTIYAGIYNPSPVLRVEIPKPDGSLRPLGIPTVLDRLIQQAIAQVLVPIFDPEFSESSCGFRPDRSAHDGVRQVKQFIRQGRKIAVDLDLEKFLEPSSYCTSFHEKFIFFKFKINTLICLFNLRLSMVA